MHLKFKKKTMKRKKKQKTKIMPIIYNRGVMNKELDCSFEGSKFELQ